jgi:hypothetical protein
MRIGLAIVAGVCGLCLGAGESLAAGFGVRAGLGVDPDQAVVGLQGQLSGKKLKAFRLAPSVDFGFGDNVTTICGNLDLLLLIRPPDSNGALYAGVGPTIAVWDFDNRDSDTEIGLSLLGGARFGMGKKNVYNAEVRFGVGDIPEIRVLFGIMFGAGR